MKISAAERDINIEQFKEVIAQGAQRSGSGRDTSLFEEFSAKLDKIAAKLSQDSQYYLEFMDVPAPVLEQVERVIEQQAEKIEKEPKEGKKDQPEDHHVLMREHVEHKPAREVEVEETVPSEESEENKEEEETAEGDAVLIEEILDESVEKEAAAEPVKEVGEPAAAVTEETAPSPQAQVAAQLTREREVESPIKNDGKAVKAEQQTEESHSAVRNENSRQRSESELPKAPQQQPSNPVDAAAEVQDAAAGVGEQQTAARAARGEILRTEHPKQSSNEDAQALERLLAEAVTKAEALASRATESVAQVKQTVAPVTQTLNQQQLQSELVKTLSQRIEVTNTQSSGQQSQSGLQQGFSQNSTVERGPTRTTEQKLTSSQFNRTLEKVEAALKEVARSKDGKTISIRLDPPSLGSVKVDVTLKDGTLHARVMADNPHVTNLLREKAYDLQMTLRRIGIDVDQVSVAVGGDQGSRGNDEAASRDAMFHQQAWRELQNNMVNGGSGSEGGAVEIKEEGRSRILQTDHWVA